MKALLRCLLVSSLVVSAPALANDYASALDRLRAGNLDFDDLVRWRDHPLYPHLATHWVALHPERVDAAWLSDLLDRPDSQAAAWEIRDLWLEELARRQDWPAFARASQRWPDAGDPCRRFEAGIRQGRAPDPDALRELWLTGDSLPEHCDSHLARLSARADFDDLVWQRQLLAFRARNSGLMRHLNGRYTGPDAAARGDRLLAVYQRPAALFDAPYQPETEWHRELALAAIDRMAYRTPEQASNLWVELIRATPQLDSERIQRVSGELGIAMAKLALAPADYWLGIADPRRQDPEIQHWRLQIALADSDWARVLALHDALDADLRQSGQWQYWSAIAARHQRQPDRADRQLADLAGERSYYGFLAADALGRPGALNAEETPPVRSLGALGEQPALRRARALFEAGDISRAQIEWNLALNDLDADRLIEAAQLAQTWQWHHKASQTASRSGRYGELTLRYPRPWPEIVQAQAVARQVPPHWIYGVIRQESHFMTDALSSAGARGLMQLMPYTARQVAGGIGLAYDGDEALNDPALNIALGSHYLDQMQQRFNDPVHATAAYNAGPSRVERWIERYPADPRVWIESIPFEETRGYVKAVLTYAQVYAMRDGHAWSLAQWLDQSSLALND